MKNATISKIFHLIGWFKLSARESWEIIFLRACSKLSWFATLENVCTDKKLATYDSYVANFLRFNDHHIHWATLRYTYCLILLPIVLIVQDLPQGHSITLHKTQKRSFSVVNIHHEKWPMDRLPIRRPGRALGVGQGGRPPHQKFAPQRVKIYFFENIQKF